MQIPIPITLDNVTSIGQTLFECFNYTSFTRKMCYRQITCSLHVFSKNISDNIMSVFETIIMVVFLLENLLL